MIYSKKRYVCSRYYSNHMKVRSIMRLIKSENIRFILKLPSSDCILSKYETWSGFKQLNKINPVILGLHWDLVFGPITIHHPRLAGWAILSPVMLVVVGGSCCCYWQGPDNLNLLLTNDQYLSLPENHHPLLDSLLCKRRGVSLSSKARTGQTTLSWQKSRVVDIIFQFQWAAVQHTSIHYLPACCLSSIFHAGGAIQCRVRLSCSPSINQSSWNIKLWLVNLAQEDKRPAIKCFNVLDSDPDWTGVPMKEHYLNWHSN